MSALLIKLSAAVLAAVGAKTADEFPDALVKLLNQNATDIKAASDKVTAFEQSNVKLTEAIAAANGKIGALETTLAGVSSLKQVDVERIAEAKGSEAAMKAVSGIGAGAPVAGAPVDTGAGNQSPVQKLQAEGKFEEAWAVDKSIQAEFPSAKGYAAYMKAQAGGKIRIANR